MKPALIEIVKWLADITLIAIGIILFTLIAGGIMFGLFTLYYGF